MPLSSAEVAAQIGASQQQHMGNMAYGGLVSGALNLPGQTSQASEQMAGGILNRGMAIAPIAAGLGAGLLGVDPISMGMSAMMGDGLIGKMAKPFGFAGRAAIGMGAAAGVGAVGMAASYGMQQMSIGMQQQQQLNGTLRQNFNFITPAGQGFSNSQMGMIGQGMRHMSGEMGPGGQMTGFSELTQLAAGMGSMGGSNAVRSAQEFQQKFRSHIQTLKQVAETIGSSLQEAQQFTQQMKSSGIFSQADQVKAASSMRGFSASGTLSVSELGAMGNIGSQISRSVGGRGKQGMFAGMKTLGMVGAALDSGTINEGDIYNATGLQGAEGRQAYATSQLSNAASFMRQGKGRWFLASLAGKDGQLNANSVEEWMGQGVGTGRTSQMARANTSKVGAANFLRNEGRLRGAALEKFGGMMPAMALMSWGDERGINIDSMNDREMLFASRTLGIGMDQLEGTVKQVRDMPNTMRKMRQTEDSDRYLRDMAKQKSTTGVQGAKRAFEHAREKVQGSMQQMGANLYNDFTNEIESFINKLSGVYVEQANSNIQQAYEAAKQGNGKMLADLTGGSVKRGGLGGGRGMMSATSRADVSAFDKVAKALGMDTTDAGKMKAAGYEGRSASDAERLSRAASGPLSKEGVVAGASLSAMLQQGYALGGLAESQGADRLSKVKSMLDKAAGSDPAAAATLKQMSKMSEAEQMRFLSSAEKGAGINAEAGLGNNSAAPSLSMLTGGAHTLGDQHREIGEQMYGQRVNSHSGKMMAGVSAATLAAAGPLSFLAAPALAVGAGAMSLGERMADKAMRMYKGTEGQEQAAGEFLTSDKGMELLGNMTSTDAARQASAQSDVYGKLQSLKSQKAKGAHGLEQEIALYSNMAGGMQAMQKAEQEKRQLTEEEFDEIGKGVGTSGSQVRGFLGAANTAMQKQAGANVRALARMTGGSARERMRGMSGVFDSDGNINKDMLAAVEKSGGASAREAVFGKLTAMQKESELGLGGSVEEDRARLGEAANASAYAQTHTGHMNVASLRGTAKAFRESGNSSLALDFDQQATAVSRASRSLRGRDGLAKSLGVGLDKDESRSLGSLKGEARSSAQADLILRKLGGSTMSVKDAEENLKGATEDLEGVKGSANRKVADRRVAEAQKQKALAEASADVKQRLIAIDKAKGDEKGALKLALDQSSSLGLLQEEKKKKQDGDNPMVKAISELKEALADPLEGIKSGISSLPAGIANLIKPGGTGAADAPKGTQLWESHHRKA